MASRAALAGAVLASLLAAWFGLLNVAPSTPRPSSVLVLGQGRSGSTFLASFYRRHPALLYIIEPCASPFLWPDSTIDYGGDECARVVRETLNCDFSSVRPDLTKFQTLGEHGSKGFDGWGNRTAVDDCSKKEQVVVKEIRLCGYLDTFSREELLGGVLNGIDYVVLLVRDPRNVLSSRIKGWMRPQPFHASEMSRNDVVMYNPSTKRGHPYAQSIRALCAEHLALRSVAAKIPEKATLIHYIDLKRDPLGVLRDVFDFTNTSHSDVVATYVSKSVDGSCDHKDAPFSVCRDHHASKDAFVDDKWREELPQEYLNLMNVHAECRAAIEYYE